MVNVDFIFTNLTGRSFILYVRKVFRKTNISYSLIHTRTFAYQRGKKWQFFGKFCVRTKSITPSNRVTVVIWRHFPRFSFLCFVWGHDQIELVQDEKSINSLGTNYFFPEFNSQHFKMSTKMCSHLITLQSYLKIH